MSSAYQVVVQATTVPTITTTPVILAMHAIVAPLAPLVRVVAAVATPIFIVQLAFMITHITTKNA